MHKDHCKAEIQPCHVTGVFSIVLFSWFHGFTVLRFFKVSLEVHRCDGNQCHILHSLVIKTDHEKRKNQFNCVSVLSNAVTGY